jgi:hypothetical protein
MYQHRFTALKIVNKVHSQNTEYKKCKTHIKSILFATLNILFPLITMTSWIKSSTKQPPGLHCNSTIGVIMACIAY